MEEIYGYVDLHAFEQGRIIENINVRTDESNVMYISDQDLAILQDRNVYLRKIKKKQSHQQHPSSCPMKFLDTQHNEI